MRFSSRFSRSNDGASAVEFGLVSSALVILLIAAIDFGMGFYRRMQVQSAAQRGAIYATIKGFDATTIAGIVTGTRGAPAATPVPRTFCACPGISGLTEVLCTATCTSGASTFAPGQYVSVSAQARHSLLLPYPNLRSPLVFNATQIVRIK